MSHADYHERCESYVRISLKDLNGPFAYVLDCHEHPSATDYPGVRVAACELAAGHEGRCEWIVTTECCQAESPNGYACNRYADHPGGHAFMAAIA